MSQVRRFDHVGITVADLDTVTAFFVGLGPEVENRMFVEGEFLDTVIGIPDLTNDPRQSHSLCAAPGAFGCEYRCGLRSAGKNGQVGSGYGDHQSG
jgi:catechol 2,3-dioxygenase-like lactoylglutathione lyase family enzyme